QSANGADGRKSRHHSIRPTGIGVQFCGRPLFYVREGFYCVVAIVFRCGKTNSRPTGRLFVWRRRLDSHQQPPTRWRRARRELHRHVQASVARCVPYAYGHSWHRSAVGRCYGPRRRLCGLSILHYKFVISSTFILSLPSTPSGTCTVLYPLRRRRTLLCSRRYPPQYLQQTVNLGTRIVVNEADPQHAAILLHAQPLGEIERIVVTVPGENSLFAQRLGELAWRVPFNSHCDSRRAPVEALRLTDAVERQPRNFQQAFFQLFSQTPLVVTDGAHRREQMPTARRRWCRVRNVVLGFARLTVIRLSVVVIC